MISSPIAPWCSAQSHYPTTANAASVSPKLEIDGTASIMRNVVSGGRSESGIGSSGAHPLPASRKKQTLALLW